MSKQSHKNRHHANALNLVDEMEEQLDQAGYISGDSVYDFFQEFKQALNDDWDSKHDNKELPPC